METYISCHQNTVTYFIAARPIIDLFLMAERIPESRLDKSCWKKDGQHLEGMYTAAHEATRIEGGKETDGTDTETETT